MYNTSYVKVVENNYFHDRKVNYHNFSGAQ